MNDDIDIDIVDRIIDEEGTGRESLIPALMAAQKTFRYLPAAALARIAQRSGISPASILGVSTFYSQFRLQPAGRHSIRVCIGTACHVKGAEQVHDAFSRHLAIPDGQDTDPDMLFTLEKVACLGCCMLAPAVQIDDITYGHVDPHNVATLIRDFLAAQRQATQSVALPGRTGADIAGEIRLCTCSSCAAGGADAVRQEFETQIATTGVRARVRSVGCSGISFEAPLVEIVLEHGSFRYGRVRVEDARRILLTHFRPAGVMKWLSARAANVLEELFTDESWEPVTRYAVDFREGPVAEFTRHQQHVATRHHGVMDPDKIDDYIEHGGFEALTRCCTELLPDQIIDQVSTSGLRGRGGAGYPTGTKWRLVRNAEATPKYVICNGDEGDPGAFMDRMILESFPFRVLEGMTMAAIAVGAEEGAIYIRAEYPLAVDRIRAALKVCEERGYIGTDILGTGRTFAIEVVNGAGAFVCGEETALIAAIEGRRGMPHFRPPYPAEQGWRKCPTLVNNVETLALLPSIIRDGAESFAATGTNTSSGPKTFALAGKVLHGGLIEVPMGTTLRDIVFDIGGGLPAGRALKAIQIGGPSGGCVPAHMADVPVDYDQLTNTGTMMGSGGIVVLDDTDCMVDIARYFLTFTQDESCGKCTFCRIGTKRMLEILEALCEGHAARADLDHIQELAHDVRAGSLCGLGRTAPNPVLSTLLHFKDEYEAHLDGICPAKKCSSLIRYFITDACIGCTRCAQACPTDAIPMNQYRRHEIDVDLCVRCGACASVCPESAVTIENMKLAPHNITAEQS